MNIRSIYDREYKNPLQFPDESRTKQSLHQESDINYIMEKFLKTGHLEHANNHAGEYGFASSDDFHASMNIVVKAQEMFDELPSATRKRFANNPTHFLDFVQNPDNREEMAKMGLISKPPTPEKSPEKLKTPEKTEKPSDKT